MKSIAKCIALDLLLALIGIAVVFLLVQYANLQSHQLVLAVALVYLAVGLVRLDGSPVPFYLRSLIISIFGILYIPLIGESYGAMNLPYPIAGYLGALTGIILRALLKEWSTTLRILGLASPVVLFSLIVLLAMPFYFDFWSTYISGPAIEFSFVTMGGQTIHSDDLKGKVIVLDYWDTHCGPCRRMMPAMEQLEERYRDDPRVQFLAVNAGWEDIETVRTFTDNEDHHLTFVYDENAVVSRAMGIFELPTVIIIDREFNYHSKHVAYEPGTEKEIAARYRTIIDRLLES